MPLREEISGRDDGKKLTISLNKQINALKDNETKSKVNEQHVYLKERKNTNR